MEVAFENIVVVISGVQSPEEAYDRLCTALNTLTQPDRIEVEYETDTFVAYNDDEILRQGDVFDLMPEDGNPREEEPFED